MHFCWFFLKKTCFQSCRCHLGFRKLNKKAVDLSFQAAFVYVSALCSYITHRCTCRAVWAGLRRGAAEQSSCIHAGPQTWAEYWGTGTTSWMLRGMSRPCQAHRKAPTAAPKSFKLFKVQHDTKRLQNRQLHLLLFTLTGQIGASVERLMGLNCQS